MDKLDVSLFYNLTKVIMYIVCWLYTPLHSIFVQPQDIGKRKKKKNQSMGHPRASKCLKLITKTL